MNFHRNFFQSQIKVSIIDITIKRMKDDIAWPRSKTMVCSSDDERSFIMEDKMCLYSFSNILEIK